MSHHVTRRVWEHSKHKGSELLLLLAIADLANDSGTTVDAIKTLAEMTRLTKRNIQYLCNKLVASGELTIKRGYGECGENQYVISTGRPKPVNTKNLQPLFY